MARTLLIFAVVTISKYLAAQSGGCDTLDLNKKNSPTCSLPQMDTNSAEGGYVSANGTWAPAGLAPDNSDVEITCVKTAVPQVSNSPIGFCLMALGFFMPITKTAAVSTNYYDVVSWGKSRIIAERDAAWAHTECETQQLVFDFPSNTVTLTSTLSATGRCGKRAADLAKLGIAPPKPTETFNLVHHLGNMYADKDLNFFLGK